MKSKSKSNPIVKIGKRASELYHQRGNKKSYQSCVKQASAEYHKKK